MSVVQNESALALEKHAAGDYPLHEIVRSRWSPRAFSSRPVPMDKIGSLLEAARWSASASNGQPWRFIVVTNQQPDLHARFVDVLMEGNQKWAKNAPVLILGIVKRTSERNGKPNAYAWYDLGQSVSSLSLQATADGLHLHQMGGFHKDQAREAFAIPDDYEPVVAIALGYMGSVDELAEDLQERETMPRTRKPLDELVFGGDWGTPLAGITNLE